MSAVSLLLPARDRLHCCPVCHGRLRPARAGWGCRECGRDFPVLADGRRDFRLREPLRLPSEPRYVPGRYDARDLDAVRPEVPCPQRRNDYRGRGEPHLTAAQISWIPAAAAAGGLALDLGCGDGLHRRVLESLGYQVLAVDHAGTAADELADAHALPYADAKFDLVLSVAVLAHLAHPGRALAEMHRVLRPGRPLVGTAAFLEPFNGNSFFHCSPLAVRSLLEGACFTVETLASVRGWNGVRAHWQMAFDWRLPAWAPRVLAWPFVAALESYAWLGRHLARAPGHHDRHVTQARHAGAFFFVAWRPEEA